MTFEYFLKNGELLPMAEATVGLSNIEYQYGFGVYETLRVVNGTPYFVDQHIERLSGSARSIGLEHHFAPEAVRADITALIAKIGPDTYNLKILLVGGKEPVLSILPLNPLFPDKKLYRDGVVCTTYEYERRFPHAKTLNMLESYLAYRTAREAGAYDALLVDRNGCVVEGTRTNFFCIKGKTLVSPPAEKILLGVTRTILLKVAAQQGYEVVEREIHTQDLSQYEGACLTSTSSGIMPVASIGTYRFGEVPAALKTLMIAFDTFVETCGGRLD